MAHYINPPGALDEEQRRLDAEDDRPRRTPAEPERDVLRFLLEHAPLEAWEHEVLSIVRDEAYYFAPQGLTKIMNEGWATYWHSRIMTEKALEASEAVDYASHHAGALATAPGELNPYALGLALWRDVEERWDKGRFGEDWEACDAFEARRTWDRHLGEGRRQLFEVRRHHNDVSFVDEFLTPEFCLAQGLFAFGFEPRRQRWEVLSRAFAEGKERLLHRLTNMGHPLVAVVDGNLDNRGELLLAHDHDGVDLELDRARDTLKALGSLWRRPVALDTRAGGRPLRLRWDGREHSSVALEPPTRIGFR
jgi:stage V sporulation protein R